MQFAFRKTAILNRPDIHGALLPRNMSQEEAIPEFKNYEYMRTFI